MNSQWHCAIKDSHQCQREAIAYDKLKNLSEYSQVKVDRATMQVKTLLMDGFHLISINAIIAAFEAVRLLHENGVIHGACPYSHYGQESCLY